MYAGYLNYSINFGQNLRLGRMRPSGQGLDIADLAELDQSNMVYQLPMINQTLCIVQMLGNS